jgi:hypothetical protein
MSHAAGGVEELLRGPNASSELRIGLRALRVAIAGLAEHLGIATDHLDVGSLRNQARGALRKGRPRRGHSSERH